MSLLPLNSSSCFIAIVIIIKFSYKFLLKLLMIFFFIGLVLFSLLLADHYFLCFLILFSSTCIFTHYFHRDSNGRTGPPVSLHVCLLGCLTVGHPLAYDRPIVVLGVLLLKVFTLFGFVAFYVLRLSINSQSSSSSSRSNKVNKKKQPKKVGNFMLV